MSFFITANISTGFSIDLTSAVAINGQIAIGGVWKDIVDVKIAIGGVWKDVVLSKIAISSAWKDST